MVYCDIHTHCLPPRKEVLAVVNHIILPAGFTVPSESAGDRQPVPGNDPAVRPDKAVPLLLPSIFPQPVFPQQMSGNNLLFFSVGIHPWYIDSEDTERQWISLQIAARTPGVVAVGEAGLDKATATPWPLQQELFRRQAFLAEELAKPLIVHCVRAWGELMGFRKKLAPRMPWVVHGFRGNRMLAQQLIGQGFYLSLGDRFRPDILAPELLPYLFFETDDREIDIVREYIRGARVLGVDPEELAENVYERARRVFSV